MTVNEQERLQIEESLGMEVVKEEYFVTFRQTIMVADKSKLPAATRYLQMRASEGRVTGHIRHNLSQGGLQNIVTEEVVKVPDARAPEIDELFLFQKDAKVKNALDSATG